MIEQWVKVNQKIKVSRLYAEDWYDSIIQDVDGKKVIHIGLPYQNSNPLILHRGDPVKINIAARNEKIEFNSTVLGNHIDRIPLFALSFPESYARVQQRRFVRLPIMMDIYYAEKTEGREKPEFLRSYTLDISGGGVKMLVIKIYPKETNLLLKFNLPEGDKTEEFTVLGRVVRSRKVDHSFASYAAIEFSNITKNQQDRLVRFIFEKMSSTKRMSLDGKGAAGTR